MKLNKIEKEIIKYQKRERLALSKLVRLGIWWYGKDSFTKRYPKLATKE